ncbi:MAG: 50S ribosomal protein L18 [Buchnera aphidicola (Chaetogeoica yunlongensis)]
MITTINKKKIRLRRSMKTRHKIKSLNFIRLVVHRTSRHMYAQIIDSDGCTVLTSASTVEKKLSKAIIGYTGNINASSYIGNIIAERALKKGIKKVSFDRSGFQYHGRIKALADSARKTGLKF